MRHKKILEALLKETGIKINENSPYDIQVHDERFYRMWKYYLLSCAGVFRARKNQLWQIVLSKKGVQGGYKSIR